MPEYYTIVHVYVENSDENAKRIRCCATKLNTVTIVILIQFLLGYFPAECTKYILKYIIFQTRERLMWNGQH